MKFKTPDEEPVMIGLTSGHTLVIHPNGTEVPSHFRREAIAKGCVPVGLGADEAAAAAKELTKPELIVAALEKLIETGDDTDFDGDGKPNVEKLSAIAGFTVTKAERNGAWKKVQASLRDDGKDGDDPE